MICESNTQKKCFTKNDLRTFIKDNKELAICNYHSRWFKKNGYEESIIKITSNEKVYTSNGKISVKESDFSFPRKPKFISNIYMGDE